MDEAVPRALLDLLPDGVAAIGADGDRLTAGNAGMRRLLDACGGAARLTQLLPEAAARRRLLDGEVVELPAGDALWELSASAVSAPRWLLAREIGERLRVAGEARAGARARALAGLAQSVVHEIGNVLNSTIGVTEMLRPTFAGVDDRGVFEKMLGVTRRGAELLRTLARLLQAPPQRRVLLDLGERVAQVLAVFGKHMAHQGRDLRPRIDEGVIVRGVPEDVDDGVLQAVSHALSVSEPGAPLTVAVDLRVATIAGDRERRFGCVRVSAGSEWIGELSHELRCVELSLRRCGGDLQAVTEAGVQWLQLSLPEATR